MFADNLYRSAWPVHHFDTLDGTNAHAVRLTESGDLGPCWIHADRQTSGRGRLGREWISPDGNLYTTALFPFEGKLSEAPLVCFVAGLAVTDAILKICPGIQTRVQLKWPNDVVVVDKKLGGILIETGSHHRTTWMAVGFGINLKFAPESIDRPTIALAKLVENTPSPTEFLTALDMAFRDRMIDLAQNGFHAARQDWLQRTVHTGRNVTYVNNGEQCQAVFEGLDTDGAMIVRNADGKTHHVRAGDVGLIG